MQVAQFFFKRRKHPHFSPHVVNLFSSLSIAVTGEVDLEPVDCECSRFSIIHTVREAVCLCVTAREMETKRG